MRFGDKDQILLEEAYESIVLMEHNENLLPSVFEQLNKFDNPLVGVHFSRGLKEYGKPHLGLNKHPSHNDPVGVYAFPRDYVLSGGLSKNLVFSQMLFFYILKPSSSAKVLDLSKLTEEECKRLLSMMGIPLTYWDRDDITHKSSVLHLAGGRLWGVMERYRHDINKTDNSSWNALFAKTGYNVLYDNGQAIIHYNEPNQIIYLETNAYEVLYFGRTKNPINKVYELFVKSFSGFRVRKNTKNEKYLYLESNGSYIKITPWQYGFTVEVGGYDEKYKKDYRYDDIKSSDYQSMIDGVKNFMSENKVNPSYQRSENNIIKLISDHYNLSIKKDKYGDMIEKRYNDGQRDYVVIFTLNQDKNTLYMVLERKGVSKYASHYDSYHQAVLVDVKEKDLDDLNGLMKRAFDKFKQETQESYYSAGKKEKILKTMSFIENRVFKIK